jgi:glucosamine kinase
MMPYFLAMDGGGTKTRARLAEDDRVLCERTTGTVKLMRVEEATATARVRELIFGLCDEAGIDSKSIAHTVFGLAGLSIERVHAWAVSAVGGCVRDFDLAGDEEIALDAAFRGGPGVLVIAGTGSNIVGRAADGTTAKAGGWGPVVGDEGSGSWIGLEAVRRSLQAQDRGVSTCLLREIEAHWHVASTAELVEKVNASERVDFSVLAAVVARCAESGDALAQAVLDDAGAELAAQVSLVLSKLHARSGAGSVCAMQVAFTGSVLAKIDRVRAAMTDALQRSHPHVTVGEHEVDALDGAMWRCRRAFSGEA